MCDLYGLYDATRTRKLTDCEFVFEGEADGLGAHKNILAIISPVFDKMFFGALPQTGPVLITDICKSTFEKLLSCIYGRSVEFEDAKEACEFYYAAKKYDLPDAVSEARSFLRYQGNYEDFAEIQAIAQLSHLFEDTTLTETTLKLLASAFLDKIHADDLDENYAKPDALSAVMKNFEVEVKEEPVLANRFVKVVSMVRHLVRYVKSVTALIVDDKVNVEFKSFVMLLPKGMTFVQVSEYWTRNHVERAQYCNSCDYKTAKKNSLDNYSDDGDLAWRCENCLKEINLTVPGNSRKMLWDLELEDIEELRDKYNSQKRQRLFS